MSKNINEKIEEYLLQLITTKQKEQDYSPLPSENFLATKFKVSRQTARLELNKLMHKGFIRSVKGSGYYLNPHINYIKLNSIGQGSSRICSELAEIDLDILQNILDQKTFMISDDISQYYGYRKIFTNERNEVVLYINSFIYKKLLPTFDPEKIKTSLLAFIAESDIKLDLQFNSVEMTKINSIDRAIFNQNFEIIPTVYGIVTNKQNEVVEIFERRYSINEFKISFAKIF